MTIAPTGMTRERPILFSASMVRALLDGTKTQTRRVLTPQPELAIMDDEATRVFRACQDVGLIPKAQGAPRWRWRGTFCMPWPHCLRNRSPYGVPAERLWVRETWCQPNPMQRDVVYRADIPEALLEEERAVTSEVGAGAYAPWRPSIFMPRWASRITLEVTDVRAQRVQEISEADARSEGVQCAVPIEQIKYDYGMGYVSARAQFAWLWDGINGKRPGCAWRDNPWVWSVTFRTLNGKR